MRSPARAITWEICARNRRPLLVAFGLIPFCGLLRVIVPSGHEIIDMVQVFSAIATFVSIIWISSYTANDVRGRFSGFPSWMYTLPLRTSSLVIRPVLLGVVLMFIAVVAWEFTICVGWKRPFVPMFLLWHLLLAVGTLVSVQALIWSLHRFRWIRIVALVAVLYGFLYVALVGHAWKFSGGAIFWFGGVALSIPLAIAGAIAGVERDRRGQWQGWTGQLMEKFLDSVPHRHGAFASASRARFWFEWRRKGFFAVVAFGFIVALCVFTYPLSAALYLGPVEVLMNFSGPFIGMIFIAGTIGTALAKSDAWSPELTVHPIAAARPSSTAAIVFAKMQSALAVTILGWALFALLLVPVILFSGAMNWPSDDAHHFWRDFPMNYSRFWRWLTSPVVILALIAATWHTIVQSMSVILTGNRRYINLRLWQGIIMITAVVGCTLWLVKHPWQTARFLKVLLWFTVAIMLLKAYGTVRAFRAVKPLVSRRDFLVLAGLWNLIALLVLSAGLFAQAMDGLPVAILWALVLWQFFPSEEIPVSVIALHGNRHR